VVGGRPSGAGPWSAIGWPLAVAGWSGRASGGNGCLGGERGEEGRSAGVAWGAGGGRATCAESVVCAGAAGARSVVGGGGAAGERSVVGGGGSAGAPWVVCGAVGPGAPLGGGGFVGGAEATVGGGFVGCKVLPGDGCFAGLESGACAPRPVGAGSGTGCDEVVGGMAPVVPPGAAGCVTSGPGWSVTSGPGWSAATAGPVLAGAGLLLAGMRFVADAPTTTARAPRAAGATVAATRQAHTSKTGTAISRARQGAKPERAPLGRNPLERRRRSVADVGK